MRALLYVAENGQHAVSDAAIVRPHSVVSFDEGERT